MDTEFYAGLITDRNDRRDNYMKYVRMLLDRAIEMHGIVNSMPWAFALDNAAGVQLDTIGVIVGLTRKLPYTPGAGSNEMDDDEYRLMLRMKIARNIWNGTNDDARQIYQSLFNNNDIRVIYHDNQDMTVTYTMTGSNASRAVDLLHSKHLLLIPGGVGYNIQLQGYKAPSDIVAWTGITGILIFMRARIEIDKSKLPQYNTVAMAFTISGYTITGSVPMMGT